MGKGIAALSYLPAVYITVQAGSTFATESLRAGLNKIAKYQENEITSGSNVDVPCLMDNPFTSCAWDIDATAVAAVAASGTVTFASALAGDTVTINGVVYTAVSGAKADNTEFSIDTSDTAAAADLADSIVNDVRAGSEDYTATSDAAVLTVTATATGTAGNSITFVSSNGTRLAVTGGGTLAGGVDPVTYDLTFASEDVDVVETIGRPALATRRAVDVSIVSNSNAFTVRSAQAALKFVEKLEDKVASTGTGSTGDGTYTDQPLYGATPFESFVWTISKSGNVYVLTPTANS